MWNIRGIFADAESNLELKAAVSGNTGLNLGYEVNIKISMVVYNFHPSPSHFKTQPTLVQEQEVRQAGAVLTDRVKIEHLRCGASF